KQVGTRAGFAHADCKAQFAAANAWQDIFLDVLRRVFQQDRSALPVGDEMEVCRRVGHAEFFGYYIPFQLTALVPAILLGPSHPDPTFGADPAAEIAIVRFAIPRMMRIESAGRNFLRQKRACSVRKASHCGDKRTGSKLRLVFIVKPSMTRIHW